MNNPTDGTLNVSLFFFDYFNRVLSEKLNFTGHTHTTHTKSTWRGEKKCQTHETGSLVSFKHAQKRWSKEFFLSLFFSTRLNG
jgi:hypothetical protein